MEEESLFKERLSKLKELRNWGIDPYPHSFDKKDKITDIVKEYSKLKKEEITKHKVSVAGRVMLIRNMGGASFFNIQDQEGNIQCYIRKDEVKDSYKVFNKLDLGDIVGVEGIVFKTKTGELSVWVKKFELLTKALRPLPEKFHGLKDVEIRYRKRYLDLIVNPEVREVFIKRTKTIKLIREFLDEDGFLEVEVPVLQNIYGGASAKPFKTHLNSLNTDVFLSISPELYLKRLVVGGFEKIYTICKNFRNEDIDTAHNPEFTMLEFYEAYANYEKLMDMSEKLISKLAKEVNGGYEVELKGIKINLKPPFAKIKFRDFIFQETKIDIDTCKDFESLKKEIIKKNIPLVDIKNIKCYGALFDELYKRVCRPKIIQPTFLIHYPVEMIALAKRNEEDPSKIDTFQLIINGAEIIKAYDELNDPVDQKKRLEEQQSLLKKGSEEAMPFDEDFVNALEIGMPPTAGFGMGIDRLMMVLTGKDSIKDVIFFPFMK